MNRISSHRIVYVCLALAFSGVGCSAAEEPAVISTGPGTDAQEATLGERLSALESDLMIASVGDDVLTVQDYLTQYGYFPNAKLAERYPEWRPIVADAPSPGVFDEPTHDAVRSLQLNAGLRDTGVVDADTRAILQAPRCGVPDGMSALDPANKFALQGSKWGTSTVTWKVLNTNDVTLTQARAAAAAAFASWAAQTSLTFTEITGSGSADIQIQFKALDGAGNVLAQNFYPQFGGDMEIDTAETWSVASPTPSGQYDLQSIMLHELGHALGLFHSSISVATMEPFSSSGTQDRTLDVDDNVGVSAIYDTFEMLPGAAMDVGAGGTSTWIIGTSPTAGGFTIFKWDGVAWTMSNGGGVRIASTSSGVPWMVNSLGEIYQRTSSSATSGSWTLRPGCAKDVGVGSDGSVWVIGCSVVPGGFDIHKWNGSGWNVESGGGGAVRIAVGSTGIPWVVNDAGSIFRRTSSNPSTGSWQMLPGAAKDIGIGPDNYAWIIGTSPVVGGFNIWVWDEQVAFSTAPARAEWVSVPGGATQISVGANGRPWLVNNANSIFRATK